MDHVRMLLITAVVSPCTAPPAAPRLDHVVIAVHDLDSTAAKFRALGYRLKPGRLHQNGLLSQHIKFRDGTGIEPMTVRRRPAAGGTRSPRVIGVALHRRDGQPIVAVLPNFWIMTGIE